MRRVQLACFVFHVCESADSHPTLPDGGQFLTDCTSTCREPLACVCGVCTVVCSHDDQCAAASGDAECLAAQAGNGRSCTGAVMSSCDVGCSDDAACRDFGADFVCLSGRCRELTAQERENAPPDLSALPICEPHSKIAGTCVWRVEGTGDFHNDAPLLTGTIVALGEAEARPECLGSDNFGRAIPAAAHVGEEPVVPDGTVWWRVDDHAGTSWAIAVAAPGVADLGVAEGDEMFFMHGVGWGGWDGAHGNALLEVAGRGRILFAINDVSMLDVFEDEAECARPGPCGGHEWSMRIALDGQEVIVPPWQSVEVEGSVFTNAGAFTHAPDYVPPGEGSEGPPGCLPEFRTSFIATRVDAL
jgi:hypothetical protein